LSRGDRFIPLPHSGSYRADRLLARWDRAPNFLLVDYYNRGNFNGSVFAAAAAANGVEYNRDSCCGQNASVNAAVALSRPNVLALFVALAVGLVWCL
jgi:hypothetical protein